MTPEEYESKIAELMETINTLTESNKEIETLKTEMDTLKNTLKESQEANTKLINSIPFKPTTDAKTITKNFSTMTKNGQYEYLKQIATNDIMNSNGE